MINYNNLKIPPTVYYNNQVVTDTSIGANVAFIDSDAVIYGAVSISIFRANDLLNPVATQVINNINQITPIMFTGLLSGTDYVISVTAANYNLNNGNYVNYQIFEIAGATRYSLDVSVQNLNLTDITTNSTILTNATFSGLGLQNIDSGYVTASDITNLNALPVSVVFTPQQISEIKLGSLTIPTTLTGLNPDYNYKISFYFETNNNTPLEIYYANSSFTNLEFYTLKLTPSLIASDILNNSTYYEKATSLQITNNFLNSNSALITEVEINGT